MAKRKTEKQAYHCDGFYFNGVCQFRGLEDAADVRYRGESLVAPRLMCTNMGLDKHDRLCPHCVENKKHFPPDLVKMRVSAPNGRVVSLTPYHAKDQDAVTKQAFSTPKELADYLKEHPDLYGVDVETGDLIGIEVEVTKRVLKPLPDYGDHMTMGEFIEHCRDGGFINYDGFGNYATDTEVLDEPSIDVKPSMVLDGTIDLTWSHIVWYNR